MCTSIGSSIVCSVCTFYCNMSHNFLDEFKILVEPTDVARSGNLGLWHVDNVMNDEGVYLTKVIFNIPFNCTLYYYPDQSLITLNHLIVDGFEGY